MQVQRDLMHKYPDDFARMAAKGYAISGIDAEKPFWDMPYDEQLARMRNAKDAVEKITHKPMRVFGSRYFAYDENTLKAADALGVEYVLGPRHRRRAGDDLCAARIQGEDHFGLQRAVRRHGHRLALRLQPVGARLDRQGLRGDARQGDRQPAGRSHPGVARLYRRHPSRLVAGL